VIGGDCIGESAEVIEYDPSHERSWKVTFQARHHYVKPKEGSAEDGD
jgi:hypothetical protein